MTYSLALAGAALLALPLATLTQSREQLVERYTTLAGSKQNATALVTGLRDGKQVKLTRGRKAPKNQGNYRSPGRSENFARSKKSRIAAARVIAANTSHAARQPSASRKRPLKKSALPMLNEAIKVQPPW